MTPPDIQTSDFIFQQDDHSCGPACLATVARLYKADISLSYDFFRRLLNPSPTTGSDNLLMADIAKEHLPFIAAAENIYHGGIAVANILHPENGEGHYVVFLSKRNEDIIYYDPYDHEIHAEQEKNIQWLSETGHLKRWSINFLQIPNATWQTWIDLRPDLKKSGKSI